MTTTSARAADGPGTKTVKEVNEKITKAFATKTKTEAEEKKVLDDARKELGGFLDIEELGKRAIKDHWEKMSAAERKEFLQLLTDLIETNYLKGMRANVAYKVNYKGEKKEGEHLKVATIVNAERKGRPMKIEIDYLLSQDGKIWRTFDIVTDGIGLVENYRSMFNRIIAKGGVADLLAKMRKKLSAIQK